MWSELQLSLIERTSNKGKEKYTVNGAPLRFQAPRGYCKFGLSEHGSLQIEFSDQEFLKWYRDTFETFLRNERCPWTSNLTDGRLRVKIDESVHVFDHERKQTNPPLIQGLFRGQELSCLLEITGNYFFKGQWGLTVRAFQVQFIDVPKQPEVREKFEFIK
jgi:hypothetical protein